MSKTIAILQSSYIPWKGYFDIIAAVDEFVIFDDVQYTRRDWRSRNRILVNGRPQWLTVPVSSKGSYDSPISEMRVADKSWAAKHWTTLRHAYGKAPFFAQHGPQVQAAYERAGNMELLGEINVMLLKMVCDILELATPFMRSEDVSRVATTPTGRLVEICVARGANAYVSGPAARAYIDAEVFDAAGVALFYANYIGYPTYDQGKGGPFEHAVSMLDAIFRIGGLAARDQLKALKSRDRFLDPA